MKKNVLLLIISSLLLTLGGCQKKGTSDSSIDDGPIVYTDKFIVENGVSTYYIVNPKKPQPKETVAASELNYFMKLATGVDIPIVNEKEVRRNNHYISLGNTIQFQQTFPDVDLSSKIIVSHSTWLLLPIALGPIFTWPL